MSFSTRIPLAAVCLGLLASSAGAADKMSTTPTSAAKTQSVSASANNQEPLVQVALLLDTSGSMKGLVDQARCQLWNMVSDLSQVKRNDKKIRLEIGVYQFGTNKVSKSQGCLRQITPFTEDLDAVSSGLFSLAVGGGDEFCGEVIGTAIDELAWSRNPAVYKAIFIAGNEPFDQGKRTFGELLPIARSKSIVVNTIYCGNKFNAADQWEAAANIAKGAFARIDHNHHLPNIPTPFDGKMRELNRRMNETFVWYGDGASKAAANQDAQDKNAQRMSDHAFASRMSTKIGHLYHHIDHDLVDAIRHGKVKLDKMPEALMPENLRALSPDERKAFVTQRMEARQTVRRRMAEVIAQRHRFLKRKMSEQIGESSNTPLVLGEALTRIVRDQVGSRGYAFDASIELTATR